MSRLICSLPNKALSAGLLLAAISVCGCKSRPPHFTAHRLETSVSAGVTTVGIPTNFAVNLHGDVLGQQPDGTWSIRSLDGRTHPVTGMPSAASSLQLNMRDDIAGTFADSSCPDSEPGKKSACKPFLLRDGKFTSYDGVGVWAQVLVLNEEGDIGGDCADKAEYEKTRGYLRPFVISHGAVQIPALPAPWVGGWVSQMNTFAQGVGNLTDAQGLTHGFMFDNNRILPFPDLSGGGKSSGTVIDDHATLSGSQYVGDARLPTQIRKGAIATFPTPGVADCLIEAATGDDAILTCRPTAGKDFNLYLKTTNGFYALTSITTWPSGFQPSDAISMFAQRMKDGHIIVREGATNRFTYYLLTRD